MSEREELSRVGTERRSFVSRLAGWGMVGGLFAGYGGFAAIVARYLYPAHPQARGWVFVTEVRRLAVGAAMAFETPSGAKAAIARRAEAGDASDFIALSSTCPHLGCRVHWQGAENRFFCPCHNGVFDPSGKAISGPPADAGQSLLRYPLKVANGLLFIEVPVEQTAATAARASRGV